MKISSNLPSNTITFHELIRKSQIIWPWDSLYQTSATCEVTKTSVKNSMRVRSTSSSKLTRVYCSRMSCTLTRAMRAVLTAPKNERWHDTNLSSVCVMKTFDAANDGKCLICARLYFFSFCRGYIIVFSRIQSFIYLYSTELRHCMVRGDPNTIAPRPGGSYPTRYW